MKKVFSVFLLIMIIVSGLSAQVKGMSINGTTGIITTPSARIGWEYSDFGLDFGYTFIHSGEGSHIPKVTLSLFKKVELAFALDTDFTSVDDPGGRADALLLNGKFQFYRKGGSSLAAGVDFETLLEGVERTYWQIYFAATYGGAFFNMPATTSASFGWNFLDNGDFSSNFNYGMGFELGLFPEVFKDYVFWVLDFSNYSYNNVGSSAINAGSRGAFNTGIRIDPLKDTKFKFVIDIVGTDLLDDGQRGFMVTGLFGFAL